MQLRIEQADQTISQTRTIRKIMGRNRTTQTTRKQAQQMKNRPTPYNQQQQQKQQKQITTTTRTSYELYISRQQRAHALHSKPKGKHISPLQQPHLQQQNNKP
jgi:hypothetical protein